MRLCNEDFIFKRKSRNCAESAFFQGDSVGGSKLTEQTLQNFMLLQLKTSELGGRGGTQTPPGQARF